MLKQFNNIRKTKWNESKTAYYNILQKSITPKQNNFCLFAKNDFY